MGEEERREMEERRRVQEEKTLTAFELSILYSSIGITCWVRGEGEVEERKKFEFEIFPFDSMKYLKKKVLHMAGLADEVIFFFYFWCFFCSLF